MHDDLECLLKHYRPAGPPSDLRARCLRADAVPARCTWPWAAAAALLLGVTLGFQAASARTLVRAGLTPGSDAAQRERAALADALGGGPEAEQMAALIVAQQELARGAEEPPALPMESR